MHPLLVPVITRNELGSVNIKFVLNEGYSNFINIVKFFEVPGSSHRAILSIIYSFGMMHIHVIIYVNMHENRVELIMSSMKSNFCFTTT